MNASISTSGRVCLCEWSGPVTVTMVVPLLSHLKQVESVVGAVVLILNIRPSSAISIMSRSSTFLDVLPVLWAYCTRAATSTAAKWDRGCVGERGRYARALPIKA